MQRIGPRCCLLACAGVFTVQMPVLRALHAAGRIWLTFGLNLLWSCTYILATLWLVESGSRGLATARLLSYTVYAAVTLAVGLSVLKTDRSSSDIGPAAATSTSAARFRPQPKRSTEPLDPEQG